MAISKGATSTFGSQNGTDTTATVSGSITTATHGLLLGYFSVEGAAVTPTFVDKIGGVATGNAWTFVAKAESSAISVYCYASYAPTVGAVHTLEVTPSASRPFKRSLLQSVAGSFLTSASLYTGSGPLTATGTSASEAAGVVTLPVGASYNVQFAANDNGDNLGNGGSWAGGDIDTTTNSRMVASKVQSGTASWTNTLLSTNPNAFATIAAIFVESAAAGGFLKRNYWWDNL